MVSFDFDFFDVVFGVDGVDGGVDLVFDVLDVDFDSVSTWVGLVSCSSPILVGVVGLAVFADFAVFVAFVVLVFVNVGSDCGSGNPNNSIGVVLVIVVDLVLDFGDGFDADADVVDGVVVLLDLVDLEPVLVDCDPDLVPFSPSLTIAATISGVWERLETTLGPILGVGLGMGRGKLVEMEPKMLSSPPPPVMNKFLPDPNLTDLKPGSPHGRYGF